MCQVHNLPFEEQTNSFLLMFGQVIHIFEETKISFQNVIGDVYCPPCPDEKCVYLSTNKNSNFFDSKKRKTALTCFIFVLRTKNRQLFWLVVMVLIVLQEKRVATMNKDFHPQFWRDFFATHNQAHTKLGQKTQKSFHWRHYRVDSQLVDTVTKSSFPFTIYTLSVYGKATWISQSPTAGLSGFSTLDQIHLLRL